MSHKYKIGEISKLLGTTVRTIRFYEEESLLEPLRTDGGTRYYTETHIARLRSILHLASNGFSLESIRLIASIRETCNTGNESSNKVSVQIDNEVDDISSRIRKLTHLRNELAKAKNIVGKCKGCKNKPTSEGCPTCPVKENIGNIELLNLIWDQAT